MPLFYANKLNDTRAVSCESIKNDMAAYMLTVGIKRL